VNEYSKAAATFQAMKSEREAAKIAGCKATFGESWISALAINAIKHIHEGGYHAILTMPYNYEKIDVAQRGKVPARYIANGDWSLAHNWNDLTKPNSVKRLTGWRASKYVPNVGVLLGAPVKCYRMEGIFASLDIDCMAPDLIASLKELFGERFAIRIGNRARSGMIPVVLTAHLVGDKIGGAEIFSHKDNKDDKVQVLQAKQFVAAGMHPSGVLYQWQDADGDEILMPALTDLPSIAFTKLATLLHEHGFSPGSHSGTIAEGRQGELEKALNEAEDESFDDIFGGDGIFPLSDLVEANPLFAWLYKTGGGDHSYLTKKGEPSHHNRRVGIAKDLYRAFPGLSIVNLKTFLCEWEHAGEYVQTKRNKGEFDHERIANAYAAAEAAMKDEMTGKSEQHVSTRGKSSSSSFGVVDDCEDETTIAPKAVENSDDYVLNGSDEETVNLTDEERAAASAEANDKLDKVVAAAKVATEAKAATEAKVATEAKSDAQSKMAARRALKFTYLDDLRVEETSPVVWVVKNLMARGTTGMLVALWGHGKTAVAIDLACHVAAGLGWNGRKVTQGVVVYVGLENPNDIKRRVKTWCNRMEGEGVDLSGMALVVYHAKLTLFAKDGTETQDEKDLIGIATTASTRFGLPVAAIFVDTLSKSIRPGKEDNDDGAIYVQALQRISDQTGACVTVLAHPSKGGVNSSGVRGGGVFEADVDTVLEIVKAERTRDFTLRADADKFRIGDPGKVSHNFHMIGVVVGKDEDGDDISVVQALFSAPVVSSMKENKGAEHDEADRLLAEAAKVPDTTAVNVEIVKEAMNALATKCFEDHKAMTQPELLKEWNRRREWRVDMKDKKFSKDMGNTQLRRILDKLEEEGFMVREGSKPILIRLLK
jgi:hypothetical protein